MGRQETLDPELKVTVFACPVHDEAAIAGVWKLYFCDVPPPNKT